MEESEINFARKWSYETNNPVFQKLYQDLTVAVEAVINYEETDICCDIGGTSFEIKYADKTEKSKDFFRPGSDFRDCYAILQQMVPLCEYSPRLILTEEQYENYGWLGRRNKDGESM